LDKKYLITVIIPHKDSTLLLQRCINSIPEEEDIEIIIVDDNSQNINKENFPGIHRVNTKIFFSDKTLTAGGARNLALENIQSDWVVFSDADDFFTKNAFNIFRNKIHESVDIFYFKVESRYSDTLEPATRSLGVNFLVDNYKKDENLIRLKHIVPWGKMFSANFIKQAGFQFDEVPASNDVIFGVKTGFYAKKIKVFTDDCIYCITMNRGSISNTLTKENNRSRYQVMLRYNLFLRKKGFSNYQNSIRPFVFNSLKFGFSEFVRAVKMLITYKGNFFYDFSLKRSIYSFFKLKKNISQNTKYVIK
jgi:glycosyltransferase involved in cell wall biosynthesis